MSVLLLSIIVSSASGIFIELESSTIGSEPKEYSATFVKLGQCVKFGQCAKSRQCSGHKAIRKKLRNLFNLNSIKANLKLKQTTTVGQTIDQGSTSHESKPRGGVLPKKWVGVCGPLPKTLTLFMSSLQANLRPKSAIFPTLFMSY